MFTQDGFLFGVLMTLLHWPILLPLLASILYFFFKNNPANPYTVSQFFKTFNVGGHRGSPIRQPENTIASMVQAKKEGADLIEFDVSLTKDGIVVILHDDTLDRTTNFTGPVRNYLFKDLSTVNCAAKFAPTQQIANNDSANIAATQASMPTLEEIVKWSKENNMKMLFDVKDSDAILVEQLNTLFDKYDLYETGIVCSFFPIVVYRIKKLCPKILTGITWRRWCYSFADLAGIVPRFKGPAHYLAMIIDVLNVWSIKTWLPSFLGVDMVLTERADISETFVQQQRAKGRYVCAWTVNDLTEMNWMRQTLSIPVLTDKSFLIDSMTGHGKKI
jgi:glycerophosphoryl diester phosphodiesterase